MQDSGPQDPAAGEPPGGRQIQPLSRRERQLVLDRIHALMAFWDISLDDLAAVENEPGHPARFVKYRHPVTGATWDGEGAHPDWLRRALLQEGLRVEELRPPTD
jgi:DNA-binding protein H-NS